MYNITYTCVVGARSERVLRGPKDFFFRLTLLPRCPPTHTALHHLLGALSCPGPLSPRPDLLPCFSARSLSPPHALTRSLRFAVSSCLCWCVSLCACAGVCVSVSVSFVCLFPCLCVCVPAGGHAQGSRNRLASAQLSAGGAWRWQRVAVT